MIRKIRQALKRLAEQPRTEQDKELKIFEHLSEDRFDEAITIHTMQTELKTIDKVFDVLSRSGIPGNNPCLCEDSRMQRLSDLWFWQQKTATVEQKDKVGMAYISRFLGLRYETARAFARKGRGSRRAYYAIGIARLEIHRTNSFYFRKTTAERYPELFRLNIVEFWQRINEIFPNIYTEEDLDFLYNFSFEAVEHFMMQLEPILAEDARINRSLRSNEVFFTPKTKT
jgi:hypothetical protein